MIYMAMKQITITSIHCDYNWMPSKFLNEYLQGFDNQKNSELHQLI
jgi:hypothetical protein